MQRNPLHSDAGRMRNVAGIRVLLRIAAGTRSLELPVTSIHNPHSNRARPEIGCEMLELTRKAASHHVLRRQEGQNCQEDDANPRQEAKGNPKAAKGHADTLSDLGGFSKRNPG